MRKLQNKFQHGITIIVPFYNSEETLLETAKSLINQIKGRDFELEVLLIDNNSTDHSSEIAKALAIVYPDLFHYICCAAPGVSNARNLGLEYASMEYIMFLDADDTYSRTSVKDIYELFKKNEKNIDIIFYPRYFMYVDNEGKKTFKQHPRNRLFRETGIYREDQFNNNLYYMTLNIAIKNGQKSRFDSEIPYGEDMVFISEILGRSSSIGYVSTAHYNYRFSEWSTINRYQSPVYSSNLILDNMEKQFYPYLSGGVSIPKQVQSMALNEIAWRFSNLANRLFPYHLKPSDFRKWQVKLRDLLRHIDDDIILNYPTLDSFHRYSVLELKEELIKVAVFDGIDFRKNGTKIHDEKNFETIISDFKITDNVLYIYSFLKMKLGEKINVKAFASINGVETELETWNSISGRYKKRDYSNYFPAYKLVIDLDTLEEYNTLDVHFYYKINGKIFNIKKYYSVKNRILDMNNESLIFKDSHEVFSENTVNNITLQWLRNFHLLITKIDQNEGQKVYDEKTKETLDSVRLLREEFRSMTDKNPNIWLYVDNFNTVDNAFYQYQNDFLKDDGAERYYVYKNDFLYLGQYIAKHNIDMSQMKFVLYGSEEHKRLLLRATFVLAAYNEYFATVVPFNHEELLELSDVLKFKYIYLQHGVLHAKAPQTYDVERTYIDKIVISTDYEREVFTSELHYNESDLLQVGMSRFGLSSEPNRKVKRILFAPSWRHTFVGDLNTFDEHGNRKIDVEEFIHSQYYKSLRDIMQSENLEKYLEKNNLDLDIKLHPIFSGAMDILLPLVEGSTRIHILETQTIDSANYLIFVTDFSSFVFDAVANRTPIIYYELDRDEFLAGNHNYRELYLGFEFGDVVDNVPDFADALKRIINRNYSVEKKYLDKMNLFYNFPKDPRGALYNALSSMEGIING
ncbi:glycosyltransferase [Leuconostoc mesenteroides]|uniref:glycosyltransferase n=1 Tax=Leuconostoc mesenteroides TaxID=1245 RepID=UPI0021A42EF6|nr:glycosyltransferase [Leuconostoc mesenteroides]MCT3053870.1 glycosyltransferase [Leuconostoc mesenteroides]